MRRRQPHYLPLKFFVVLLALFSVFAAHIFEKNRNKKAKLMIGVFNFKINMLS